MKPTLVPLPFLPGESFSMLHVRTPGGSTLLNYHTGWQITNVLVGQGTRIVGDNVAPYHAGDLVLLGPYLPHMWRDELSVSIDSVLVTFSKESLGDSFLRMPELRLIDDLCRDCRRGIRFMGESAYVLSALISGMQHQTGPARLRSFLEMLQIMAETSEREYLASPDYAFNSSADDEDRLTRVFQYISENIHREIGRAEVAQLVHLSEGAFSRFFSLRMGRSLPVYINEVRIGRACRLLMETNKGITEIALTCGYNSLSHFNRQFSLLKNTTPSAYRIDMRRPRAVG